VVNKTPRRRRLLAAGAALLLLLAIDFAQPPRRQVSARFLLAGIDLYQATLSPLLGKAGARCRFQPTCSHYGEGAIRKHGALLGTWKTMGRIARCGPWTPAGTVDPP
jgi:putative membrane protein insertion efficiency factor